MDLDSRAPVSESDIPEAPQEGNNEAERPPEKHGISSLEGLHLPPPEDLPKDTTEKPSIIETINYPPSG